MAENPRPGADSWITPSVTAPNDPTRPEKFYASVFGPEPRRANGAALTPQERENPHILFLWPTNTYHFGSCVQPKPLPPSHGLGTDLPRYGYYIRQSEMDNHLRRLDHFQVNHSDPIRTSAEGEPGVVIYWEDPDQNQLEFWAPDRLPEGAMAGEGPLHIGRFSGVTLACRDLDRSTEFFASACAIDP